MLILPLPFLGDISLQLRTKLRKWFKNILNCCKVQIVFKSQGRLSSQFCLKEALPSDLMSKVVCKYTCGRCNSYCYGEIGSSPLTFKKCKPSKESAGHDRLFYCDSKPFFEEFSVLGKASSKLSLEIKESLVVKGDTPNLNRNTASVELFLFDSR